MVVERALENMDRLHHPEPAQTFVRSYVAGSTSFRFTLFFRWRLSYAMALCFLSLFNARGRSSSQQRP